MAAVGEDGNPWFQPSGDNHRKQTDVIVDMESSEGFVVLNGESGAPSKDPVPPTSKPENYLNQMQTEIGKEMAGQMWQAGKQSARRAFDLYANVDLLRPYFDVEPRQVAKRLLQSLIPRLPSKEIRIEGDLYGPTVLTFTLVAILLLTMKASGHTVREGTLMGTAIGVSFFYWLGTSLLYFFLAYLFNSSVSLNKVLSLVGYGMFGPCLCLLYSLLFHSNSGSPFYLSWILLTGFSALRIGFALASTTLLRRHGFVLGSVAFGVHLLFVLYVKLAYSKLYEAVSLL
ncbi:protein YIPF3-like [Corticium candelabrum]|uniref:protein YIPF3-like n=1 Tax=Corticium candelabrum TaxID=121492 RepID=UPI002E273DF1|nr:protein YIPF3-like [Corticium candelabrum]